MAKRHECLNKVSIYCSKGSGKGPHKCKHCKSVIRVWEGVYGVFTHRGDGGYRLRDAHATFQTERAAQRTPSQYIGGTLADDILDTPGYYVAMVVSNFDSGEGDGWAVARRDA